MVQNDFPGINGEEQESYPLRRQNSVPRCVLEIQKTPQQGHPAQRFGLAPILVVTMSGVAETFKSLIDEMTAETDVKPIHLLYAANVNGTHETINNSVGETENRRNIHLVSHDTLTSRAKPSSNSQLSYCSWSFGIFDESFWYKTKNCVGW
jgi:hypothetical protein